MKVILLENLRKVGSIGDIIDIKRGYARNYLISKKKALFASKTNIDQVSKIKSELNKKDLDKKKEAKQISELINNKEFIVKKLCTENKELYGSVKPTEISKIIREKMDVDIHTSLIQPIKEIKTTGVFKVVINLHSDVQSSIKISVVEEDNK